MIAEGTLTKASDKTMLNLLSPCSPLTCSTTVRVYGDNLPALTGVLYRLSGYWKWDSEKEPAFIATSIEEKTPADYEEAVAYLSSIEGITEDKARVLLWQYHYDELDNVITYTPEKITQNPHVKISRFGMKKIRKNWIKRHSGQKLFEYLSKFDMNESRIMKIYDRFLDFSMDVVINHPYKLMGISGMEFEDVDRIALENKIERDSFDRLSAGILEALRAAETGSGKLSEFNRKNPSLFIQSGSTCLTWKELYALTNFILQDEHDMATIGGATMCMDDISLKCHNELYSRLDTFRKEQATAGNIARLQQTNAYPINLSDFELEMLEKELIEKAGFAGNLAPGQKNAVKEALKNAVTIVTGGPGTGKTTIEKAIIYILEKYVPGINIQLIAPTGRAASRMSESTGYPASTIHSALGLYDSDDLSVSEKKIRADVILIDEFSMVDCPIADRLFASVPNGTKVICIGDVNQLPPVGAGASLKEIIDSNVVPVAVLTDVFRQKKGSSVTDNAYAVNNGDTNIRFDEFFSMVEVSPENAAEKIAEIYKEKIEEFGVDNVCVLTPYRRTTSTGVNELNPNLQKLANRNVTEAGAISTGDRVMHTRNARGIANGDIGIITQMQGKYHCTVKFGERDVEFRDEELNDLVLAYSTTIHKSQGSEYPCVILVADPRHSRMVTRPIFYTAITRAKKQCIIVGSRKVLDQAITDRKGVTPRRSLLAKLLQEAMAVQNEPETA